MKSEFLQKFSPLRAVVLDEGAMFSCSKVFSELLECERLARQIGEECIELAQVLSLMSHVQWKRGHLEDTIEFALNSLRIQACIGALPAPEPLYLHHRIASAAHQLENYPLAVEHYQQALQLFDTDPMLGGSQRLSIRQDLGFSLFEVGRYGEALITNLQVLKDAEHLFGPHDERLTGVLNNLAQNEYELENFFSAETFLRRRLDIARQAGKSDIVHDTLFQLGVLAFEAGSDDTAREWFEQMKQEALESGDPDLIEQAEQHLDEFNRRLAEEG